LFENNINFTTGNKKKVDNLILYFSIILNSFLLLISKLELITSYNHSEVALIPPKA
jgi:hypothetical protein